jgi:hypothetical protein
MGAQRELEVARAVLAGAQSGALTGVNGLALADKDGKDLSQLLTRRGTDGEEAAAVVGGLDLVDWFYVAERAARYQWGSLDVR